MTINRRARRALGHTPVGLVLAIATMASMGIAGSANASASQATSDSLGFTTKALRTCQSRNADRCGTIIANLARLKQIIRKAPTASVSGRRIHWQHVTGIKSYVVAHKYPGHGYRYSVVENTTVIPPVLAGKTVDYWIRTNVTGSAWTPPLSISFPGQATQANSTSSAPDIGSSVTSSDSSFESDSATSISQSPTSSSTATASSQSASATFQTGLNSGTNLALDVEGSALLGAKLVRVDFPINDTVTELEPVVASYAAKGIRVLPLASFAGTMPTSAEARALATWAKAFGPGGSFWSTHAETPLPIESIEFGNETSSGYQYGDEAGDASFTERAETYALRLEEAAQAISAEGLHVGLLAQEEDWTGDWIDGMYAAVPNLGDYVAGWVSHPYGTDWKSKFQDIIDQTASHGASPSIPIDVTEWGLSTDNGNCVTENYGWNQCMSYQEAADLLRTVVAEMRAMLAGRLGLFMLYQVRDQQPTGTTNEREAYFGLLQHELQPKGPYTAAAEELLAAN
jgi:hypothetical protein